MPESFPLYRGSNASLYNPYEHASKSSAKFIDFQLSRAIGTFPMVGLRLLSEQIPLPNALMIAIAALIALACYLLLRRRFETIEARVESKQVNLRDY